MNLKRRMFFGAMVLALLMIWTHGIAWAQQKFRIGYADPLTGTFGRDGNLVKDAYNFWAELVNAKGGIEVKGKKYPVELIVIDDNSNAAENAKFTEKLITRLIMRALKERQQRHMKLLQRIGIAL